MTNLSIVVRSVVDGSGWRRHASSFDSTCEVVCLAQKQTFQSGGYGIVIGWVGVDVDWEFVVEVWAGGILDGGC